MRAAGFSFLVWLRPAALLTLNETDTGAETRDERGMAASKPAAGAEGPEARMSRQQLVFVVPVYNESQNVPRLLADFEARPELFAGGGRLILVDDGSTDGTADLIAAHEGAVPLELVRFGENQGPGAAFRAGFEAALQDCTDEAFVVTLEGDTTSDVDALPSMLARAEAGADLVLADWQMVNVGRVRRTLSVAAGVVVRKALGLSAGTVSSFFRVYRASALRLGFERFGDDFVQENGFACKAEILAKLTVLGVRVDEVEVPLDWSRRLGTSKMPVLRTMLDYWRMLVRLRSSKALLSS
jgi:dolichol-phosphate mannosyltransferase